MANPLFINKPSIRFRNYFGIWEQKRLGDLISRGGSGGTPNTYNKQYYDGLIPFLGISDISNSDGVIYKTEKHISEDGLLNSAAWIVPKGAISLAMYASVGKVAILGDNIATSQAFYNMVFSSDNVRNFVYEILKKKENDGSWESLISTGTQANLNADKVINLVIRIPEETEEIKKISDLFLKLDHLIVLNQQKYHRLLCIKKSMLEKMFPKNGSNIPEIRFAGFTDAWEQRKFDEVFDCTIPNNTLSRAELNYESGSVRNIHYGDILIKYGSVVDVQNDEIPFATGKSSDDFKGALLQDGDIIIADTAEDETTGKACEIGNSQGLDVVSGLHTMVCRPRNKMALGYLGYYLNSDAYHHQLLPLMQGIKVLSLSRTNVQKTMVCYPKSKTEQQLIADCFRNLDNLITLHQRKYEFLTKIKESLLNKMFI